MEVFLFSLYHHLILHRSADLQRKCDIECDLSAKQLETFMMSSVRADIANQTYQIVIGHGLHGHVGCCRHQLIPVLNLSKLHQHPVLHCRLDGELVEVVEPEVCEVPGPGLV